MTYSTTRSSTKLCFWQQKYMWLDKRRVVPLPSKYCRVVGPMLNFRFHRSSLTSGRASPEDIKIHWQRAITHQTEGIRNCAANTRRAKINNHAGTSYQRRPMQRIDHAGDGRAKHVAARQDGSLQKTRETG